MMQQYLDLKDKYPDCILFYRMGDFYEMFYEDAVKSATILDIALTKRGKEKNQDIPMCGVPFHAYQSYLEKLIKAGNRVAICEQLESPEEAKKRGYKAVVKRDVVRVVTAGTVIEDNLLDPKAENYLLAVCANKQKCALAWADITTGNFNFQLINKNELADKLAIIAAREIILSDNLLADQELKELFLEYKEKLVNFPDSYFATQKNKEILKDYYQLKFTDGLALQDDLAFASCGAIISYLQVTQKEQLPVLNLPQTAEQSNYLELDRTSLNSLEIFNSSEKNNSIIALLDKCMTAQGSRFLRTQLARPIKDKKKLEQRLKQLSYFYEQNAQQDNLRSLLKNFPDAERAMHKLLIGKGSAREFLIIVNSLKVILELVAYADEHAEFAEFFANYLKKLQNFSELFIEFNIFSESPPLLLREGGFIRPGIDDELDRLKNLKSNAKEKIAELEVKYREATSINNLKIRATNIMGYYIEIPSSQAGKMNQEEFAHKQTLANNIRYTSRDLQQIEAELANSADLVLQLELKIFAELLEKLRANFARFSEAFTSIAIFDFYSNLAYVAHKNGFCKPEIVAKNILEISGGFHPVVKNNLKLMAEDFTANDCNLAKEQLMWLITGPNMAGKSTFLRQNALIILLGQIGSYVPATQAKIGVTDRIFCRVGASDDLARGRSTFMVEMLEAANILNNATERSFIILDEIGRGTATFDGASLAGSIIKYIHDKVGARTLFATHYHELGDFIKQLTNFASYHVLVSESAGQINFKHQIVKGLASKSYGVAVAALAGMPKEVISDAKKLLADMEEEAALKDKLQLSLFEQAADVPNTTSANVNAESERLNKEELEILENLKNLNIDEITPKQAMDLIYEYQKQIK